MSRPIRPEQSESLASYRAELASWVTGHVESIKASALSFNEQSLSETVAELGTLRRDIVGELKADGTAAEGFDSVLAAVESIKTVEGTLADAVRTRVAAASRLAELEGEVVRIEVGGKIVEAPTGVPGMTVQATSEESEKVFVSTETADKFADGRKGLAAQLAATSLGDDLGTEDGDDDDDAELPLATIKASISFHGRGGNPVAFGSTVDVSDIESAMFAAVKQTAGMSVGGRQVAVTIDKYAHVPVNERVMASGQDESRNSELLAKYAAQHGATRRLRASLAAAPTASRFSQVPGIKSLKAAADLCVQGRINYDIRQCAALGRPFTDCVFVDVPSDRGSLTNHYGRNFDRSATPAGITFDCPDGSPSNKTCFTITECATPQTVTLCAQAVCIKVGVFSKLNHPEQLRNEIHLVNVAADVAAETKALNWIRSQSIIVNGSPFYGSTPSFYANMVRTILAIQSDLRMNGFGFDIAMPWWAPYHMLINETAAGGDRGKDWTSVENVIGWMRDSIPGLSNVCTYIDTATAGGAPSQLWDPIVAGPVPAFPAITEFFIIPEGFAGRLTAPGIDMGSSLEEAKMFSDADRTGNVLSLFNEEFYGFAKMHDCGKLVTLQLPLCSSGVYAPNAVAELCGNDV